MKNSNQKTKIHISLNSNTALAASLIFNILGIAGYAGYPNYAIFFCSVFGAIALGLCLFLHFK